MKAAASLQHEAPKALVNTTTSKAILNPLQLKPENEQAPLQAKVNPLAAVSYHQNPLQLGSNHQSTNLNDPLQLKQNKTGLPGTLKAGVEHLSGIAMDDVRVHYNSAKPATINALAYAKGTDIHIAPGQEHHLPHEAWHVVQQKQGRVKPTLQMNGGMQVNNDTVLEKEADIMGKLSEHSAPDRLKNQNYNDANVIDSTSMLQPKTNLMQSNVIQGRFGFEVELNMLLTSEKPIKNLEGVIEPVMTEPKYLKMPVVAKANNFSVHCDHHDGNSNNQKQEGTEPSLYFGKTPIVELVTRPLDEFRMTESQVGQVMQELVDFANDAYTKTGGFKHRALLKDIQGVNTVPSVPTFIGSERKSLLNPLVGGIQMTQGIRLDRVSPYLNKYIKQSSGTENKGGRVNKSDEIIIKSRNAAAKTIIDIWENYSNPEKKADKSSRIISNRFQAPDTSNLSRLEGLIILIANYLIAGNTDTGSKGWLKNYTGSVFYKSELSSVVNQLTGFEKKILKKRYNKIAELILTNTERNGDEPVIYIKKKTSDPKSGNPIEKEISTEVLCREWVLEVLQGKKDRVFEELKNDYASQIEPEKIGIRSNQNLAAIIENRKLAELLTTKGRNPGDWVKLGKEAFRLLLELNG